jgi:Arc/MetJ-type ribon-helix-helix transcriptional regulator
MPTSVRLDAETQALIARLARKTRRSKSEVIRAAIAKFAEDEAVPGSAGPYDGMKHLIGIAVGGPRDLSVRSGQKFRQLLLAQRR